MPLLLHTIGPVPARVVERVASFCAVAQIVADVRHRITVELHAKRILVQDHEPGRGVGWFVYCDSRAAIQLAGLNRAVLSTLAHEIGHYQQWRDGEEAQGPAAESDADRRGKRIMAAVRRSAKRG